MEEIECKFCSKTLSDPVTFPCGHSFCLVCVRQIFRKDNLCPTCQEPFGRPFKVNEELKERVKRLLDQHAQFSVVDESDELKINSQPKTSILSLPDYTLIEIMKCSNESACILGCTCKKLNEIFNRDDIWMEKILDLNPHFKHQIGAPWKKEYISLLSRRKCYLDGGIKNYNANTILQTPTQLELIRTNEMFEIVSLHDNEYIYEINLNNEINKIELPIIQNVQKIAKRGNKLLILGDGDFYKYDLINKSIICKYSPHNDPVALLMNEHDFLVTKHSVLQISDNGSFNEAIFPNFEISDAMFFNKNIVLIGKELDKKCVQVIDGSGKCIQMLEFENVEMIVNGWRMVEDNTNEIVIRENAVYCGNQFWIPGEATIRTVNCQNYIKTKKGNKDINIQINVGSIIINNKTTHIDFNVDKWFLDEINNRIITVDIHLFKATVIDFNKGIKYSMVVASGNEVIKDIVFNSFDYKLYVILNKSVRVIQFGR